VTPVVAIAAVAGLVMVAIPISPEEKVEVRGAGPIVSPLGIGLSTNPPIVATGIVCDCPPVSV